jgi:hypothetical protein
MLFLLAMEPLHRLFRRAQDSGLLGSLSRGSNSFRLSLYADVAATFIKPTQQDLEVTLSILQIFVEAPGLCTNMNKTKCYPIQCGNINLDFLSDRNLAISSFPCKYMGLPLHFKKPNRAMLQPVIQKLGDRLSGWKRNFFSYLGRELLVKSILLAMPAFFLIVFKISKWAHAKMDKYRRSFLWKGRGPEHVSGGHCLIN